LDVGAYDLDQTSLNVSGRPMAPHGTVTTSSASAGQKTTGRKSKTGNGTTQDLLIQKAHQVPNTLAGFSTQGSEATKEILFRVTDFFDSSDETNGSGQYWYRLDNTFFRDTGATEALYQDIHSVDLYAIPRFSIDTAASPVIVLFGVPVASQIAGTVRNAAQCSTLLMPSSVSKWQKVGSWSASRLLNDATQSLVVEQNTGGFDFACLGMFSVVDPDDYSVITTGGVQFKIVIRVRQSLPLNDTLNVAVERSVLPTWGNPGTPGLTFDEPVQIEALALTNVE